MKLDMYTDGGTKSIQSILIEAYTNGLHKEICIDNRLFTTTRGKWFYGHPDNNIPLSKENIEYFRALFVPVMESKGESISNIDLIKKKTIVELINNPIKINHFKDGGTLSITHPFISTLTDNEHNEITIDRRIGSQTKGEWFYGYPDKNILVNFCSIPIYRAKFIHDIMCQTNDEIFKRDFDTINELSPRELKKITE